MGHHGRDVGVVRESAADVTRRVWPRALRPGQRCLTRACSLFLFSSPRSAQTIPARGSCAPRESSRCNGPRESTTRACAVCSSNAWARQYCWRSKPGTLDAARACPGQTWQGVEGFGQLRGWVRGEARQGRDRNVAMLLPHRGAVGWVQSGTPGGVCAGMVRGHDHHKAERAGAHPLQPLPDGKRACDPRLQGASAPRASPRCAPSHRGGDEDAPGKRLGCPGTRGKEVIGGRPETASLCSTNVGGPSGATTRERCVETQQGGERCFASAGIGSGAGWYW